MPYPLLVTAPDRDSPPYSLGATLTSVAINIPRDLGLGSTRNSTCCPPARLCQEFVTQDVQEFSTAVYDEANSGRWNVAMALIRPLPGAFGIRARRGSRPQVLRNLPEAYGPADGGRLQRSLEAAYRGGARNRQSLAASKGTDGLLKTSKDLNRIGSELLHHGIGLSRVSADNDELRRGLVTMAHGRAQLAFANVLLAMRIVGAADTLAWRAARQVL